jgi:hypothetical protein
MYKLIDSWGAFKIPAKQTISQVYVLTYVLYVTFTISEMNME